MQTERKTDKRKDQEIVRPTKQTDKVTEILTNWETDKQKTRRKIFRRGQKHSDYIGREITHPTRSTFDRNRGLGCDLIHISDDKDSVFSGDSRGILENHAGLSYCESSNQEHNPRQ